MTNDQENISSQVVSGSEANNQEKVQLTELLPVEQSRIEDNSDYRDNETTDGLRALRSFRRGEDENFATQRELDCFRKSYETAEATTRKCRNEGGRITRSVTLETNYDRRRMRKRKKSGGEEENFVISDIEEDPDETKNVTENMDEDSETLREETEDDEVYYYRQNNETNEIKNDEDAENSDIRCAEVYRDMATNFSDLGSSKKSSRSEKKSTTGDDKSRGKRRKKGSRIKKSSKIRNKAERASNPRNNGADAEKDLRLKMDGIIQANYLLEQENNNVDEKNHNEIEISKCSGSSSVMVKMIKIVEEGKEKNKRNKKKNIMEVEEVSKGAQSDRMYVCPMCDARFKGSGGLRNHYKVVHGSGPFYKCDECGKEFPLKERLKLHVRTHTGFKPYKCPDCNKSFARGGQLVQHRGTHSNVKPYRCNLCAGTFTCAANLALHIKRHNGQKDHKCELCGRGFVRKDALKKHLECLHRDVKSFLCVICNKTFKGHLPQHMRTHAQDRPHGCATCGQRFAQKSQLTVHQRTHSGQRPFRCLVCWQAFAHSTALKLHTRRHTGERPFKCAECNAGFTQLPHWKKHMKCIHGRNEPYSCKYCDSFFRIKNDLENHEKACHSESSDLSSKRSGQHSTNADCPSTFDIKASSGKDDDAAVSLKFRSMNVERMRLLLAVLLKRISRPERLDELGFGKRLIDDVLQDSLVSAGKRPTKIGQLDEFETLRKNLETFLEWTVPKEHWEKFRRINKTPEEILETLTAT